VKKTFRGGAHPPEFKLTADRPIETLAPPALVQIPVTQHIGAPGRVIVAKGDQVKIGQPITEPGGFVSVPTHASIAGTVKAVGSHVSPLGREIESVTIESDGTEQWVEDIAEDPNWASVSPDEIRARVRAAGLAGMGGAAFPTHVKLAPPAEKPIDTVIINGAECEPYLTSDHRLMLERPQDILEGARLVALAVGAKKIIVGIENNKPDAWQTLRSAVGERQDIQVEMLPVKYPQGAEKQLINALTRREVPPPPGLPMDVGCLVQNVGSCVAIYDAVRYRRPLIERVVTVTGSAIAEPKNVLARIGTPFADLINHAGGYLNGAAKLLMGGPMMGISQWTDIVPVIKGTSGIVVLSAEDAANTDELPCIGCGRCVAACPVFLLPTNLARLSEREMFDEAEKIGVLECIECGTCTYVCPSKRNLVQHIRFGKTTVMAMKRKSTQKQTA